MKATKFTKLTTEDHGHKETAPLEEGRTKKVVIDKLETPPAAGSLQHLTPYERMTMELERILDARAEVAVYDQVGDKVMNVTPKLLSLPNENDEFSRLTTMYGSTPTAETDLASFKSGISSVFRSRSSKSVGYHMSIEDIMFGIGPEPILLDTQASSSRLSSATTHLDDFSTSSLSLAIPPPDPRRFVRIVLRKTELKLLYEQHSSTAIKNTEDGKFVALDNRNYDYLTVGSGKTRSRSEAEAQTSEALYKSRATNTHSKQRRDVASYVSNFEMFDTYQALDPEENKCKGLPICHGKTAKEQLDFIGQLPSFLLASLVIKRLLASNTFEESQREFRSMTAVGRTVPRISYKYSVKNLFTIKPADSDSERKAVADMSFCCTNSDILAVAYGIYSYQAAKLPKMGEVCVWSIKNPCDPERFFHYSVPAVAVEFSPYTPALLAIGLFDGSIEVRDVSDFNQAPLATLLRSSTSGVDPVLDMKWIKQTTDGGTDINTFLALSQGGSVAQLSIKNSPYLSCLNIMNLERLEGVPEGLRGINPITETVHSNRSPQAICLTNHPVREDIYHILTDEGCVYKCSTNYQQHFIQALKTHDASVNHMDFCPWSPKLFLTCGNDWCMRIWIEGILEPLITLRNLCKPYTWAKWSRTHSTILVAINGKQCELWDLKRSVLRPMSTTELSSSSNTTGIFSLDGHSILTGTERGDVLVNVQDEMPFPARYQYEALEKAIFSAISSDADLSLELKNIGYFGYPNKAF